MVGIGGFEPPTPASRRRCSTRLSYIPNSELERAAINQAKTPIKYAGQHWLKRVYCHCLKRGVARQGRIEYVPAFASSWGIAKW